MLEHPIGYPYASRRTPCLANNVVATSHGLATQAGLSMLHMGGNAIDAALGAAIALTVVEPTSNGIGSDAFCIIWDGERLHGLNACGRSPKAWTPERFAGREKMPESGWDTVTVPGAVDAWARLHERFGRLPFETLFAPAIRYAREGHAVTPITAAAWTNAESRFGLGDAFAEFRRVFLPRGRAPRAGERWASPDMAATLEEIAVTRGESFYRGPLAERIAAAARGAGGAMTAEDLGTHRSDWVGTVSRRYRDVELHEIPPSGQGLVALMALGMLGRFDIAGMGVDSADSIHAQVEAIKIAFVEARRHIGDASAMRTPVGAMLDDAFLRQRGEEIRMDRAGTYTAKLMIDRGTVCLSAADADGMMVSFIQSNFHGFGSGIVAPGTGISLQNRGMGFTLEPGHANQVAPRKRPFHTIIPGFLMRGGGPLGAFGLMGGHMQPQGHVQMVTRMVDFMQNPQTASDAPRWFVTEDWRLAVEPAMDRAVVAELRGRGHDIIETLPEGWFGGAQIIMCGAHGYIGASDHRKDGAAAGF